MAFWPRPLLVVSTGFYCVLLGFTGAHVPRRSGKETQSAASWFFFSLSPPPRIKSEKSPRQQRAFLGLTASPLVAVNDFKREREREIIIIICRGGGEKRLGVVVAKSAAAAAVVEIRVVETEFSSGRSDLGRLLQTTERHTFFKDDPLFGGAIDAIGADDDAVGRRRVCFFFWFLASPAALRLGRLRARLERLVARLQQ